MEKFSKVLTSFGKTAEGFNYVSDAFSETELSDWYELLLAVCDGIDLDSLEDLQIGIFDALDKYLFSVMEDKFNEEKSEHFWSD